MLQDKAKLTLAAFGWGDEFFKINQVSVCGSQPGRLRGDRAHLVTRLYGGQELLDAYAAAPDSAGVVEAQKSWMARVELERSNRPTLGECVARVVEHGVWWCCRAHMGDVIVIVVLSTSFHDAAI